MLVLLLLICKFAKTQRWGQMQSPTLLKPLLNIKVLEDGVTGIMLGW
jgi:hypothetical protein